MDVIPTVTIRHANGKPVRINEHEYDKHKHGPLIDDAGNELSQPEPAFTPSPWNPGAPSQSTIPATVPAPSNPGIGAQPGAPLAPVAAPLAPVTETVVNPAPGAPLPSLVAQPGEATLPAGTPSALPPLAEGQSAAPVRYAAQIGDKWFVVDATGNKVMDKGFASQDAANKAITAA